MKSIDRMFQPFSEKMKRENLPPVVIETFRHYYSRLVSGETGLISRDEIAPVEQSDIADLETLPETGKKGRSAFQQAVVIKLNGGLGTSMGLYKAKSLLEVKDSLSFLDITVKQLNYLRKKHGVHIPILFMNSFRTEADTLKALAFYHDLSTEGLPLSFIQHKFPKILQKNLSPATWPENPQMEWNPPGHGDIYTALVTSGTLKALLAHNITYAFVSNSDNLGATFDERILTYLARKDIPFLMEVTDRTEADSKGGHLARLKQKGLTLREIAQCPEEELKEFQNISLFKYFNTNSIWINLKKLDEILSKENQVIPLSMIRNPKFLDPRDKTTPAVFQLETAMGSAISVFEKAEAIRVPRERFAPVKKCRDLLAVWSDIFVLNEQRHLIRNPSKPPDRPLIELDERYFNNIDDLKARFPDGAPSLIECDRLKVEGDISFGKDVKIKGEAIISNRTAKQVHIAQGTEITGDLVFD